MPDTEYKVIRVLVEESYLVPMHDKVRTQINGWTLEEVKEDWFQRFDLNRYHATRDSHRIGNGRQLVKVID